MREILDAQLGQMPKSNSNMPVHQPKLRSKVEIAIDAGRRDRQRFFERFQRDLAT